MIEVLKNPAYARLFAAQVIALTGTGLLTVGLGLLAYDLAGNQAGAVLGTVFAIKMIAYVGLAPVANALAGRWSRKRVLIAADIVRALVALMLPFIDAIWQIYALIFVLQAASATFTPAFQATIPDILSDERDYTRALSLSRLAYDLENLLSPALAALLLAFISYHWLFGFTVLGFVGSALLVLGTDIGLSGAVAKARPFLDRLTRGIRIYVATPRLRGLLALNLTAAAAGAFVLLLAGLTLAHALYQMLYGLPFWGVFLLVWGISGMCYAAILTPSGRMLRNSSHAEDRPALFAAQFTLSHVCWLITYPIAGWAGSTLGLAEAMAVLGVIAFAGVAAAIAVWPADDTLVVEHDHADLPPDHPHLRDNPAPGPAPGPASGVRHRHVFVIDDEHRVWPSHG